MIAAIGTAFREYVANNCFRVAAALSFHAIFALAPLLVSVVILIGLFVDSQSVSGELERRINEIVGQAGAEQMRAMIDGIQASPPSAAAAALAIAAIIVGVSGLLAELQAALNVAFDVPPQASQSIGSLLLKRIVSFAMLLVLAAVLVTSMLLTTGVAALRRVSGEWVGQDVLTTMLLVLDFAATLLVYVVLFSGIQFFMPDIQVAWSNALAGGVFTAICFMLGRYAFGTNLGSQDFAVRYGAASSLVLVLMSIYYSASMILLGAEFTQAWSQRGITNRAH